MKNLNYKNENIERKYLRIMRKNRFLKIKNSVLELEKSFIELKDIELKDREVKIKREIEKNKFEQKDKFEQKEIKKIRLIKNNWYGWLINYIPEPIRKRVGGFKDKIVNLFKTNTPKKTVYGRREKLSKPKKNTKKPLISQENKQKLKIE